jgi:uncharacterized protein
MNILDFLTNGQASQLGTNGDGAQRLVANLMMQRSEWLRSLLDSSRNVDADCGYPTGYIDPKLYWELYQREPIATRVVEVYPKESWQVNPQIFEDEDVETVTPFEEAWDALGKQLRGEQSFYQEEEASVVFDFLCDADIKCGIGHYAAILLGFDDGAPLDQPIDLIDAGKPAKAAQSASSSGVARRLLFMQVYPETAVRINSLEADMQSPRYGLPTEYDISMMDPLEFSSLGVGTSLPSNRASVHWTRVVHISEYGVLHTPRQRPVLNRLLDLRKLYGGSAEMYWRGAFPGYAIKTQPQLGADVDINREDVKQQLTDYSNALQRFLVLMGMDITALAPQVSDPASQIDTQITAICIQLGIPKRIFMGSERGELASSQDDAAWNDRLKQRQLGVITPRIIIPFVDRLIATRVLPRPAKGYRVSWPDLTSKSDEEKAGIATQRTQAVSVYVAGQLETTLAPMDFWTRIMGFTEDEAQSIIDNAEELKQQKEKEQAAKDAEAARVQAEAQAKADESARLAADATGSEQPNTAPGSPTSPKEPFGGKGSQSPTSGPPNAFVGQLGGSTVGAGSKTPIAHQDFTLVADFDPSQPRDTAGKWTGSGEGHNRTVDRFVADEHVPADLAEHGATLAKQKYTTPLRQAILNYTSLYYESINSKLRTGQSLDKEEAGIAEHMDSLTKQEFKAPVTVYRGVGDKGQEFLDAARKSLDAGGTLTDHGYGSVSLDPKIAGTLYATGNSVVFQMQIKRGAYIAPVSSYQTEQEIIVPRGMKYKIMGIDEGVAFPEKRTHTVIRMMEVD